MAVLQIKDKNGNLIKLSQDNLESVYANEYPKQITLFQNISVNTGLQNCVLMFSASATDFSIYRCVIYDGNIKMNILGNEADCFWISICMSKHLKENSIDKKAVANNFNFICKS